MARNDGIDCTFARNQDLPTLDDVAKVQEHNEREKDNYSNQDIDTTQTYRNIHFKAPTDSYAAMFDQMIADRLISTRGLKADAVKYGELIFDVNSAYFHNHGGYEYAKQFYTDAYKAAVEIVGGEQYILSAVMHADELNTAMTEKYGRPIYHYHMHIMALPVVDKEVRWTKRCKDPELVGKVKEVIHQVSHSKKWKSEKALDENGNPILNSKGKQVYHASYSILQDKFYEHMQEAGFNGFSRGERGSTAENLASLEFKIKKDKEKLSGLQEKIAGEQVRYEENHNAFMTFNEIDSSGKKSFTGKYIVSADDYEKLTTLAKQSYSAVSEAKKLQEENRYLTRQIWSLQSEVSRLKTALSELTEKCRPYLEALKAAPKAVKEFIDGILERFKKQEKSIYYEPIPAPKTQSQERGKHSKNKNYER